MVDVIPKITDIASIKGISSLLALPMLCVAYILQTDATIGFDNFIWFGLNPDLASEVQLNRLILIFLLKSLWISGIAAICYSLVAVLHFEIKFPFLQVTSIVLLAFALFGLFASDKYLQLKQINQFWCYSFIVWGVFLQTMQEQLNAPLTHRSSGTT